MYLPLQRPWLDPRYFYAGPTYSQAKKVAWDRMISLIPPQWIAGEPSLSELSIKTVFGSELFIVGLDKPQRIEGLILDGGVIDENSDIKPGTFDLSILPTLVWRNGWVDFIGVPKRFGIGAADYRERCEKAANGELPDSATFTWPSAGIVPAEYLELCRATMDERDFDEQFNASWVTAAGGIFHAFDREFNVRPCVYDPALPLVVTSDFNVDPMAWVLIQRQSDMDVVVDELWIRNTNTPAALDELMSRYGSHKGGFQMYGDASAKGRRTSAAQSDYAHIVNDVRLKKLGRTMHYTMSNPLLVDRFAATNARICSGDGVRHVFVDPKCKNLIRDLETRTYKPGTRETADTDDQGHPTDALGYYLHKRYPLNVILQNSNTITIMQGV